MIGYVTNKQQHPSKMAHSEFLFGSVFWSSD